MVGARGEEIVNRLLRPTARCSDGVGANIAKHRQALGWAGLAMMWWVWRELLRPAALGHLLRNLWRFLGMRHAGLLHRLRAVRATACKARQAVFPVSLAQCLPAQYAGLVHHDFNAAVLGAAFGVVAAVGMGIGGNRVGSALAFGLIVLLQALGDEPVFDGFGARP